MKWELHITSYGGIVPGAVHYYGEVYGEHPRSCHGGSTFNHPDHRGKTVCAEGHEIPEQVHWTVEAAWTEDRYNRYAAKHFEGDGPNTYYQEHELVRDAISRFLGELPTHWWEEDVPKAEPGDELYLGHVSIYVDDPSPDGWGHRLAVIPDA